MVPRPAQDRAASALMSMLIVIRPSALSTLWSGLSQHILHHHTFYRCSFSTLLSTTKYWQSRERVKEKQIQVKYGQTLKSLLSSFLCFFFFCSSLPVSNWECLIMRTPPYIVRCLLFRKYLQNCFPWPDISESKKLCSQAGPHRLESSYEGVEVRDYLTAGTEYIGNTRIKKQFISNRLKQQTQEGSAYRNSEFRDWDRPTPWI